MSCRTTAGVTTLPEKLKEAERRHRETRKQLESRIEYLKGGFETFKAAKTRQFEESWAAHEAVLVRQAEAVAQRLVRAASSRMALELEAEDRTLRAALAEATALAVQRQQAELEEAQEARAADEATLQRLEAVSVEVAARQAAILSLRQQLSSGSRDVPNARTRLAEAEAALAAEATPAAGRAREERLAAAEAAARARLDSQEREVGRLREAHDRVCEQLPPQQRHQPTRPRPISAPI